MATGSGSSELKRTLRAVLTLRANKFTHHHFFELGNGPDEGPHPLPKRLRVDGSGGCADGGARRALLGVGLHKMKCPKQVLRAAFFGEEGIPEEEIPNDLHGLNRSSEELAEVPRLPVGHPDGTGHPVLDVPCLRLPINVVDVVVVVVFVVVVVVDEVGGGGGGGHHLRRRRREGHYLCVAVWCVVCCEVVVWLVGPRHTTSELKF